MDRFHTLIATFFSPYFWTTNQLWPAVQQVSWRWVTGNFYLSVRAREPVREIDREKERARKGWRRERKRGTRKGMRWRGARGRVEGVRRVERANERASGSLLVHPGKTRDPSGSLSTLTRPRCLVSLIFFPFFPLLFPLKRVDHRNRSVEAIPHSVRSHDRRSDNPARCPRGRVFPTFPPLLYHSGAHAPLIFSLFLSNLPVTYVRLILLPRIDRPSLSPVSFSIRFSHLLEKICVRTEMNRERGTELKREWRSSTVGTAHCHRRHSRSSVHDHSHRSIGLSRRAAPATFKLQLTERTVRNERIAFFYSSSSFRISFSSFPTSFSSFHSSFFIVAF